MAEEKAAVATATGVGRFATRIEIGDTVIQADEPRRVGGDDSGPTPYQLLSGALAACTSMTLRLYAAGKDWELPEFEVAVTHRLIAGNPPRDRFDRMISFKSALDPDRFARLVAIADRCPVHRSLVRTSEVVTTANGGVAPTGEPACEHARQMEDACEED